MPAVTPRPGHLGQVGQVGELAEHQAQRLVEAALVVAGQRPDPGGERHPPTRVVSAMVAEPTTRVPS